LDQLATLCEEIAALAKAGVPLQQGLRESAAELPRRLAKVSAEWSTRLAAGESLAHVLQQNPQLFPPAFHSVLQAGVQSGDLPAALASVAHSARTMAELRESLRLAWIYPYCLLFTAFGLLYVVMLTLPVMWDFMSAIGTPLTGWDRLVAAVFAQSHVWYPLLGLMLVGWMIWDWRQRSAQSELSGRRTGLSRWGSGWRQARDDSQQAAFCELLALLVEHQLPLPAALRLAAAGSHPSGTVGPLEATCARLERGDTAALDDAPLPPLVACVLRMSTVPVVMADQLRKLSASYRRRAAARVSWAGDVFAMVLAWVIGGLLVAFFAFSFLYPWLRVLWRLLDPQFA
jgi:type II secretory pathway component PulF